MNRRKFLINSGLSVAGISGFAVGAWYLIPSGSYQLNINGVRQHLNSMKSFTITALGAWSPSVIFSHLAQSIELSLSGYPEHKSELFKSTVGKTAFQAFKAKGQMHHGLDEPIPGAASIDKNLPTSKAIDRLELALDSFEQYQGQLSPHFAYGELSKPDYEIAHALHFYNHLSEIAFSPKST